MASSTKTENYQLNQYRANDQPTWVGDYSGDMLKIDTALGNAAKRTGDKFNETETYAVGNLCIKDDLLYKFTAAKEAGAWDETKVKATTIEAEFEQLNGDIASLTEKVKDTKDISYESVDINSDGYGVVEVGISPDEKIMGANIMSWESGILYGGPTIGNNGNGYGYIFGKPNSVVTNISIRWRIVKV